jgi:hypothetical protein
MASSGIYSEALEEKDGYGKTTDAGAFVSIGVIHGPQKLNDGFWKTLRPEGIDRGLVNTN